MTNIHSPFCPTRRSLIAGLCILASAPSMAQNYPARPVRLVVPGPPGSFSDLLARMFGQGITESLGQTFVVDNKPGAGGILAATAVAKAPADGYTLLLATDSLLTINPFMYVNLPYDSVHDFQPVSTIVKSGVLLIASKQLNVQTLSQLQEAARSRSVPINYGSGGNGHTTHIAMELFLKHTGLKMAHIPYRGTAQAMQALLGGEIDLTLIGYAEALPHIKAERVAALAATGPLAKAAFPELPELKVIHKELDFTFWFALMAPAKIPSEIIARLNEGISKVARSPVLIQKLAEFGAVPSSGTPTEASSMIASDLAKYSPIIKALGLKVD